MSDDSNGQQDANSTQSALTEEEINQLGSAFRSGTFAFVAEYEKQYAQAIADGIDTKIAAKMALEAAHTKQSQLFLEYAAASSTATNPRMQAAYAEAALEAARQAQALSNAQGPIAEILSSYSSSATTSYSTLMNASPALRFAAKYGGPVGDVVDIGAAVTFGTSGDVAKAIVGAAMGAVGAALVGSGMAAIGIVGVPAAVIVGIAAIGVGVIAPEFVPQDWWDSLGNWGKDALKGVADWFEDAWYDTAKWWATSSMNWVTR